MNRLRVVLGVIALAMFVPSFAYAQAAIAGVVRDTSGALLPGVTVEASSPALIQGSRTVVTDGAGQYRIIDLRPGTYTVTFTLAGFRTIRREGIELTGTFTAPVSVEMQVGALEESITVTGEAPIVDVSSSSTEARMNSDIVAAIPTGRQYFNLAALVPGMSAAGADVGGSQGPAFQVFRTRGGSSDEGQLQVNGFPVGWQGFGISYYVADLGAAQEVAFGLSGGMGDVRTGGPMVNVIGREGGNSFAGQYYVNFANGAMEGSNLTQAHRDAGLRDPNVIQRIWDTNVNFGGPIMRDRLWFFSSFRHQGNRKLLAGLWENVNAFDASKWTYVPDLNKQARETGTWINGTTRLTWQASQRNKLSVFWDEQNICRNCLGGEGSLAGPGGNFQPISPEANPTNDGFPQRHAQALWTSPVNNRLLLEGGASLNTVQWGGQMREGENTSRLIRVTEQAGLIPSLTYRSSNWNRPFGYTWTWRGSASYVTGSHTAKVGYEGNYYWNRQMDFTNSNLLAYQFNNGVPNRLTMTLDSPRVRKAWVQDYSLYAQDQWTRNRLTLQGSVRYEQLWGGYPEQRIGPSAFLAQQIVFQEQRSPIDLRDVTPRFGATYDLFGTGKTALKVNFGRYTADPSGSNYYGNNFNPANNLATSTNRSWTDVDGDFVADCDLLNPAAHSAGDICGAWSDRNFGNRLAGTTYDPDVVTGWNKRRYTWDFNAGVRHELLPRVGIEVDYVRRTFGNFTVTDNRLIGPGDFDQFCITAPVDPRLPADVSGSQICDLWDLKPEKFGQADNFVTFAENFGNFSRVYNGVNASSTVRMANGLRLQGGVSVGSTTYDECELTVKIDAASSQAGDIARENPSKRFCRQSEPWYPVINGLATYIIPRIDVQVSGTLYSKGFNEARNTNFNAVEASSLDANWNVPNALIQPSLGRPLAGNAANTTVNLVEPGTLYGDWITNLDVRVAKVLRLGERRLMVGVDIYNALNAAPILTYNPVYGAAWLRPSSILQARFAKISAQIDF